MHRFPAAGIAIITGLLGAGCSPSATPTAASGTAAPAHPGRALFDYQEVMVPMRDGARLQTVILRTRGFDGPLPILIVRTPYGVPDKAFDPMPAAMKELAVDGYIFVIQNLRGRFKSEGTFTESG